MTSARTPPGGAGTESGRSEPPPSWLGPSSVPRAKNRANKAS